MTKSGGAMNKFEQELILNRIHSELGNLKKYYLRVNLPLTIALGLSLIIPLYLYFSGFWQKTLFNWLEPDSVFFNLLKSMVVVLPYIVVRSVIVFLKEDEAIKHLSQALLAPLTLTFIYWSLISLFGDFFWLIMPVAVSLTVIILQQLMKKNLKDRSMCLMTEVSDKFSGLKQAVSSLNNLTGMQVKKVVFNEDVEIPFIAVLTDYDLLIINEKILNTFDEEDIFAMLAHEYGHLKDKKLLQYRVYLKIFSILARWFLLYYVCCVWLKIDLQSPQIFGWLPFVYLLNVVIQKIFECVFDWFGLYLEKKADAYAINITKAPLLFAEVYFAFENDLSNACQFVVAGNVWKINSRIKAILQKN